MAIPPPKTVGSSVPEPTRKPASASSARSKGAFSAWQSLAVRAVRMPFLLLIRLYQKTLSLDHGPLKMFIPYGFCRFTPTCSQYGYEAIERRGILVGSVLTVWRILRCNPFAHGGVDPVPEQGWKRTTRTKD